MANVVKWVKSYGEHDAVITKSKVFLKLSERFPVLPFVKIDTWIKVVQFDIFLSQNFMNLAAKLADKCQDREVTFSVVDPDPIGYYLPNYGYIPEFSVDSDLLRSSVYEVALGHKLDSDPTGTIANSAHISLMWGSSGRWAVWGQRNWEIAVISTDFKLDWQVNDVQLFTPTEAIDQLIKPLAPQWIAVEEQERVEFLNNAARFMA